MRPGFALVVGERLDSMTLRSWTVTPSPNRPVIHGWVVVMITPTAILEGSLMQALIVDDVQVPPA
jgi:hypothetical protein